MTKLKVMSDFLEDVCFWRETEQWKDFQNKGAEKEKSW